MCLYNNPLFSDSEHDVTLKRVLFFSLVCPDFHLSMRALKFFHFTYTLLG